MSDRPAVSIAARREAIEKVIHEAAETLSQALHDLEEITGKSYAIVLNDGETYTGFSGCTIDEIVKRKHGTGDEGLNDEIPSIAGF